MILVVDDDKNIRLSLKLILERNGYEVALAEGPKEAIRIVRNTPAVELVLMDMNYNMSTDGEEGLTLLKQVKVFRPDVPCILMTAWGSIDLAVQGMRAGAFDFITKPWDNGVLVERVETAIKVAPEAHSRPPAPSRPPRGGATISSGIPMETQVPPRGDLEGASPRGGREGACSGVPLPSLASIYTTIARIAPTNAPVLITGESGTGKELIAEAIHRQSRRANGPFVKVNLGGISSSLFESEMFGHKKGSFTDAKEDRVGRFELANGGTIFLDEIGELDLACQVKLLRVLQDQTYEVLGDSRTRRTDVRVVCATNADLRTMVAEHTFREDLFYRINTISLHLPPLRERRGDIPLLVDYFLQQACTTNRLPMPVVGADAIAYLQTLPLSGNIRELKNLVERTLLMGEGKDFNPRVIPGAPEAPSHTPAPSAGGREGATLDDLERAAIATSIQKNAGNLSLVAKELGISRGALYRKIEKHGL
ncbi:MAG: sigma-54-dependent Fis family transcriptional regulator [Bacteroidaceae bacterium]|nr:sigma-54-dependent Fis family transcriptional regulator [Bacteroidaceae bacterium]